MSTALEPVAPHLFTTRQLQFLDATATTDYQAMAAVLSGAGDDRAVAGVVSVRQVHGRGVLVVRSGEPIDGEREADAVVSVDPGRIVSIRTADCVPVLLADTQQRLVAAIHAGWRGIAAEVVAATLDVIRGLSVHAADLVAAIGPAIGPCCYQVDRAVRDQFATHLSEHWFAEDGPGHWRLDLVRAVRDQLTSGGVPDDAVRAAATCTRHQLNDWHSFRRDGPRAGRMVAAIQLRSGTGR